MIGASVRKYEKMCEVEDTGGRPIHRSREWKVRERQMAKELKRTNRHKTTENQVSAPLILDPISGEMSKEMREVAQKLEVLTGWRVPVVERAGLRV